MAQQHITIKDLTSTEAHPDYPRNVTLSVDPDGTVHLLGLLSHQTKLGIDHINAALLIKLLKPIADPTYNPADDTRCGWSTEDVKSIRPDLTIEQCREVMDSVAHCFDANNWIDRDNIKYHADDIFPKLKADHEG